LQILGSTSGIAPPTVTTPHPSIKVHFMKDDTQRYSNHGMDG
jgi:hypothetical protein